MMTFDLKKPVATRDGRPVRIIATDKKGNAYPIVALVPQVVDKNHEQVLTFASDGIWCGSYRGVENKLDLVNVPKRRKEYRNVGITSSTPSCGYQTLEQTIHIVMNQARLRKEYTGWVIELTFEDEVLVRITPMEVDMSERENLV